MSIINSLKSDYKLIKKTFTKKILQYSSSNSLLLFCNFSLFFLSFLTLITQKDLTSNFLIKFSPFRSNEISSIYYKPKLFFNEIIKKRKIFKEKQQEKFNKFKEDINK